MSTPNEKQRLLEIVYAVARKASVPADESENFIAAAFRLSDMLADPKPVAEATTETTE